MSYIRVAFGALTAGRIRLVFSYTRIVLTRPCFVSYTDEHGIRHTAEVTAASLFEAAALGVGCFRRSGLRDRTITDGLGSRDDALLWQLAKEEVLAGVDVKGGMRFPAQGSGRF